MDSKPEDNLVNDTPSTPNSNPDAGQVAQSEVPVATTDETITPATSTTTGTQSDMEFSEHTIMAALAYVGPLVFIPLLMKKDDAFTFFHVKQGLVLFGLEAVLWLLGSWFMMGIMFGPIGTVFMIIKLALFVLSVIGIINAVKRVEKEIPLVGKFASHIKI